MKQWCEQQRTRVCVPHTPYTPVLKFVPLAGRVSGAATHAVGIDAGYGLLKKKLNNTKHLIAKTDSDYSESVFYLCLPICNLLSDDLKGRLKIPNSKPPI